MLTVIPLVGIVVLYVVAFSQWRVTPAPYGYPPMPPCRNGLTPRQECKGKAFVWGNWGWMLRAFRGCRFFARARKQAQRRSKQRAFAKDHHRGAFKQTAEEAVLPVRMARSSM